jgi:hypothetical protein
MNHVVLTLLKFQLLEAAPKLDGSFYNSKYLTSRVCQRNGGSAISAYVELAWNQLQSVCLFTYMSQTHVCRMSAHDKSLDTLAMPGNRHQDKQAKVLCVK